MQLQYRLISKEGSSIGISSEAPEFRRQCEAEALAFVAEMFRKHRAPDTIQIEGMTPEIISDKTLKYIEDLEYALTECYNLMTDINPPEEHKIRWGQAIDEVNELIG